MPVMYGNFHKLPIPMAHPAETKINPNREPNFSLSFIRFPPKFFPLYILKNAYLRSNRARLCAEGVSLPHNFIEHHGRRNIPHCMFFSMATASRTYSESVLSCTPTTLTEQRLTGIRIFLATHSETAAAICDYDTSKLEVLLQGGLDLDDPIQLSEYIKLTPLEIAVFRNDVPMIHFLLEHGADPGLAEEQPLLLTAARCCGPEVVALFAGQAAKLSPKQKERAFQEVRWGKRPENIPVLEQAGITVDKFGGEAFRAAVSEGNTKLARLLLEKGADINYHKPDMVFPYASTPVTEAARSNNFPMVRWLVEQGAAITLVDKYGDRPYSVAVQNKNQEMADYLKALEPEDWHNKQEKIRQLMPYKLPAKLVEYLKTGPLRLEFPDQEWVKWAELYSFMDVQEMTWKRKKLLSLMVQMDNYSDYLLLWSPRDKKLWYLDIEHEEFHPLAKWDDFIADPGRYLNGMIEGEFEE